jgi:hypothetical protein
MRLLGRRWRHPALTELHYVLFSMLRHFVPFSTLRVKMRVEAMV